MSEPTALPTPDARLRLATAAALAGADVITPLPLRALAVTGADALTFLQGQVTTDMREVTPAQSRLGCLLNLKGRIQASFRVLAIADGFLLVLPADQFEPARLRLAKYAVFSKVTLAERPLRIRGVLGGHALARLQAAGWTWPDAAQQVATRADALLARLPGDQRALLLEPAGSDAGEREDDTPDAAALAAWHCAAVAAGELLLPQEASERWQPQEMDYHQLQGVSYQKGCYLGQEIVARLYFRGQLKTALTRLRADWPSDAGDAGLAPGQDIRAGERGVGEIVSVAWPDAAHVELLALLRQDAESPTVQAAGRDLALSILPFTR